MDATALVIPVEGPMSEIEWPEGSQLDTLYRAIGCTTVTTVPAHDTITVWADDEGLLVAAPVLNPRASALCEQPIVGTVVVSGPADSEGNTLPLSGRAHLAVLLTVEHVTG